MYFSETNFALFEHGRVGELSGETNPIAAILKRQAISIASTGDGPVVEPAPLALDENSQVKVQLQLSSHAYFGEAIPHRRRLLANVTGERIVRDPLQWILVIL